jgi:hypothetical protein
VRHLSIARELAIGSITGAAIGLAVVLLMLLSGCIDKEKRQADFMGRCEAAKFQHEQCVFLLAIVEKTNSNAELDAAVATSSAVSGMAAGAGRR